MTCKICGKRAYSEYCVMHRPKKPLKRQTKPIPFESAKSRIKRLRMERLWHKTNKPDENGFYTCYLQISSMCPIRLSKQSMTKEHVMPKVKAPELKFDPNNIRPACKWCNKLKGSRTLEQLAQTFPQVQKYIIDK